MNLSVHPRPRSLGFDRLLIVLGAIFLSLVGGLLTAFLPWQFVIGAVALIAVAMAAAVSPHVALLFVLMLVFEVVPQAFQPRVPAGPGKLQLYDVVILVLAAFVLLRAWAQGQRPLQSLAAVRWPLYYLLLCLLFSLTYVRYFAPNIMALAEARQQIMWLVVPLMVLSADTPHRFRFLVRAIVVIGLVIALYVTLQSLFDIRIMTAARVEVLNAQYDKDITRSIAGGGIYVVVFALFFLLNRVIERQIPWFWGGVAALLLVAGLAVQFGRGVWIASGVGLLVSAALFKGVTGVLRITIAAVVTIGIVYSAAAIYKPRMAEALADRVTGISTEVKSGGSFAWRMLENQAALKRIESKPLTGVGIGGEYKQTMGGSGFSQETTYIHNGYLYFPLKMGVFSAFVPSVFIAAFVVTIRQARLRHGVSVDRGFEAALCGAFAVPVVTSVTQPEWSSPQGVAAYATFMGLALLYRSYGTMPRRENVDAPKRSPKMSSLRRGLDLTPLTNRYF